MFRKSPFLLVINKLLSQSLYPDISLKLVDIIKTKKRMFSGKYVKGYEMMNSAVKGYQWDLMTIFANVIDSCTNHLAETQLKKKDYTAFPNMRCAMSHSTLILRDTI